MNWTYRVDDHTAGTALDDDLGLGLDGVAVVRVEQDAVVASCALVFVPEQRVHGHRPRLRLLEVQRHATNVNADSASGLDAASPGFAHELCCCSLVVGDFEQTLPLLWLVGSVFLSLPNTLPQALESTVPGQSLLSRNIWQQFDFIRELEIVFSFIATLFTVLCELIRLFFDSAVDEHLTLWVF